MQSFVEHFARIRLSFFLVKASKNKSKSFSKAQYHWGKLSDEKLLNLRFCDLNLTLKDTKLERLAEKLCLELHERGFVFRPHFWLSTEWFAPEDSPGIALPFYLAHPRLMALERRQVFEVEGGTEAWCLKLLRHEAGHAIDTAYRLHRRKRYRELFGRASLPYPTHYFPKPHSRKYVLHLDLWYAQAHPVEDFAETFAVWLTHPKSWRRRYEGWGALKKLEFMDELMEEIRAEPPEFRSKREVEPISKLRTTLREHYKQKCERYGLDDPAFYDQQLKRLFPSSSSEDGVAASAFLRKHRRKLRTLVARWSGEWAFTVDQILGQMIERSRALKLRAVGDETVLFQAALAMLSVQATHGLLSSRKGVTI